LFIEMLLPDQKRAVKRGEPAGGASPLARAGASGLALALLALGLSAGTMEAAGGRALKAYRAGNFPAARLGYERLMNKRPEDSRLHFNVGATAYQAADYEAAEEQFQASLASPDLTLQQGAYYNLGNTRFRIGEETSDLKTRQAAWEQAVTHYESALQLNAQDQDAQFNLDLVQRKLEELKQQQEQQQKNQPQDQPQDKSEEEKDAQDNQDGSSEQKPPPQEKQSGGEETPRKEQQPPPPKDPAGEQKDGGSPQESKEEEGNPAEAGEGKPEEGEGQETLPSGQTTPLRMSIEQARRLLDGMKGEERALIFLPQTFTNRSTRVNKNW
jgi:Ca-activated chloride channel family protein